MNDPFSVPDAAYDYSIAGLKFNAAVNDENPIERAFARVSKEMVNTSPQPGDASLDGWWIRSATDWTGGAGYDFMEPIEQQPIPKTYAWSYGVDPWTKPGEISLLQVPGTNVGFPVSAKAMKPHAAVFGPYMYVSVDARLWQIPVKDFETPNNVLPSSPPWMTLPSDVLQLCVGQGYLLASTAKNGVIAIDPSKATREVFTAPAPISMWYVKDRFILAAGPSLYEATVKDTSQELSKSVYTSPDAGWVWTSATSTPSAILVSGRSGPGNDPYSAIFAMTLEGSSSGPPTLTTPTVTAEFPAGEYVRDTRSYLGTYLLISTTRGVRVGLIGDSGQITYGPLLGCNPVDGPFVMADRFAWAPVFDAGEGRSGVIRFDLSSVTDEQKVPWSYDYRVPVEPLSPPTPWRVRSVFTLPDQEMMLFLTDSWRGVKVFALQPGAEYEQYGVIQSGQIRMGSTVPKSWSRFSLYAKQNMQGRVKAEIVTPTGVYDIGVLENPDFEEEWSFANLGLNSVHASIRLTLSRGAIPPGPPPPPPPPPPPDPPGPEPDPGEESWNSLRTRTWGEVRDSDLRWEDLGKNKPVTALGVVVDPITTEGAPVVEGWALRGTPAIERTELIRAGVLCFDWEMNNQGMRVGADGQALARYRELVARLQPNTIVEFTDLNNGVTDWVTVDEMSYRQIAPPTVGSGYGGVIDLVLRVL